MDCTWLKSKREQARLTQYALATELGEYLEAVRRWENCHKKAKKQVPYASLAKALNVSEIVLCEDHARDLQALGRAEDAERARNAADTARCARNFPDIDPWPIQQALEACHGSGLSGRIAQRDPFPPDPPAQAQLITRLLSRGKLADFSNLLNLPMSASIDAAADQQMLHALHGFLTALVRCCAAKDPQQVEPGQWHPHQGEGKSWAFRAMIDHSQQLDGLRLVRPVEGTKESRLDDSPDSTLAVRSGAVTQADENERLRELVKLFADTIAKLDNDPPPATDAKAFKTYCDSLDAEIFAVNDDNAHVFGLWDQLTQEADSVKARLVELLPSLRLFDCGDAHRANSVLRVDTRKLEAWFTRHLRAIKNREPLVPSGADESTPTTEPSSVQKEQPDMNFHFSIASGNGNVVTDSGRDTHVEIGTNPSSRDQAAKLLKQLLDGTESDDSGHYTALRKSIRNAQGELEETKRISETCKQAFQRAVAALPSTDKAMGVAIKLSDLLSRLPGA